MIISIPMNTVIARWLKGMQEAQMKNRDQRTRLMSELLANIRSYVILLRVTSQLILTLFIYAGSSFMHGRTRSLERFLP